MLLTGAARMRVLGWSSMVARARGLAVLLYGALAMALFFAISIPVMIATRSGELPMWLARRIWAPYGLRLAGVTLRIEPLPTLPHRPLLFVSNHESALDIWVVLAAIPGSFRFVAKQELFRLPILGWYLSVGGHIPVDRHDHLRAVESLHRACTTIRGGTSLVVFPEGTRSGDGRIHPFKKGPFVLAMETGVPVIPIAVSGSGRVTPPRRIAVEPGSIRVALGEAIHPRSFASKDDLLVEVRRCMIALHRSIGGLGGDPTDAVAAPGVEGRSARV
jgi:1-acyl-sn-glycerol-3-phosphate acyltransferase